MVHYSNLKIWLYSQETKLYTIKHGKYSNNYWNLKCGFDIEITTYIDRENKIEPTEVFSKKHRVNSSNFDGIYLGDVYTTKNKENPQKIDILFYNSNKLYEIDEIRYSIYNSNGYARDNRIDFNPVTGNPYLLTLPEILETEDIYYIEIQFLKNNTIMKELSIEYAYM